MTGTGVGPELIRLTDVSVDYGEGLVLQSLDVHVHEDQFTGIVGPSGSGKTTLLRVMLGQVRPSHGKVTRSPHLRVGYVPQLETVDWNFPITVSDCVLLSSVDYHRRTPRMPWSSKTAKRAAHDMLERLGISDLAHRQIRNLSGGQQQRMFLARALLRQPQLLLLDEPTSGVDVTTRHDVLHLLADLHEEGVAIVLTTHDLNGMAAHLPHLICVNRRVVADGTPDHVISPTVLEETFGARMEVLEHLGMRVVVDERPDHAIRAGA